MKLARFSYVRPFTDGTITQNTNLCNIFHLYSSNSASTSLGKREGVDKGSNKKWPKKEGMQSRMFLKHFFYVLFSMTQSFLLRFSWSCDNTTASNKKSISKKEPISVPEITISYLQKNVIIPLLCQCELFIHKCVSKISTVSKDVIFYLLWYKVIRWSSQICKSLLFSHFIVS